jgi:hypothetical protein
MNKLLVSVNHGSYQEIFSSLQDKVSIEFTAQDEDSEPALSIDLANGTHLKFKYTKTAADEPSSFPQSFT